jgi:hydrogenase nickel incorporation protein HypA/HybF
VRELHELSLADAIVRIACDNAGGRQVARVEVSVGRLRQVVPSALEFAFELVAQGTAAESAELAIEQIPARLACRACGAETLSDDFPLACGTCGGWAVDVVSGEEFCVEALEVETEPVPVRRR